MRIYKRLLCASFLFVAHISNATHLKGGEIEIESINGLTVNAKLVLYLNALSPVTQDTVAIDFGDGTNAKVYVTSTVSIDALTKKREYKFHHVYGGEGGYKISFKEQYRNADIINMANPLSTNFYVETWFVLDSNLTGYDKEFKFLLDPIVQANAGDALYLCTGGYVSSGDSLVYQLTVPKMDKNSNVSGYWLPNERLNDGSIFQIDAATGLITWDKPAQPGVYAVAILVNRFINGALVSYAIRDFQIYVAAYVLTLPSENLAVNHTDSSGFYIQLKDTLAINLTVTGQINQTIRIEANSELISENKNMMIETDSSATNTAIPGYSIIKIKFIPDSSLFRKRAYIVSLRYRVNENYEKDLVFRIFVRDPNAIYVTSITDGRAEWNNEIRVYPNPVSNCVHILNDGPEQEIVLYNIENQLIKKALLINGTNTLDLQNIKAGIYFYKSTGSAGKILKE